jgi:hypothetical protein
MEYLTLIVSVLGLVALIGVFCRMKPGFGPFSIRALSIVLVATFATLLGLKDNSAMMAAMGILGGIAGYVFGIRDNGDESKPK